MTDALALTPGTLTLADCRRLYRDRPALTLDPDAREAIADSAATVAKVIASGALVMSVPPIVIDPADGRTKRASNIATSSRPLPGDPISPIR